jgi:hypothetical protein
MTDSEGLNRALDAALSRTLTPPRTPPQLRARLRAAVAQARDSSKILEARLRFEREQREVEQQYVRLRRRSLGAIVGGSFAVGAVAAVALPWLTANLGPDAPLWVACAGTAIAVSIAVSRWLTSRRDSFQP